MFSKVNRATILNYQWVWIVLLTFLVYFPAINNFFGWDDFLWLYRAKTLSSNPSQIFNVDTLYFDPLVHLLFWLNFKQFGLDYRWYHITDITFHAINGLLVYRFVNLYSENSKLAFLSGLIFVSAFAASDGVLWSSSRVDLLATLFSLVTIIVFIKYLREGKRALYIASLAAYVLALGAKGTPLAVPILLFWLFMKERQVSKKQYSIFIPFAVITFGYFFLLRMATGPGSPLVKGFYHPNIYNYSLSLSSLFIPELVLSKLNLTYPFSLVYSFLFILWLIKFPPQIDRVKSTGLFMMFLFLTPVLILGNLKLASSEDVVTYYLLGSPSHRIYLATVGMSLFMGSIVITLGRATGIKSFVTLIIIFLLSFNIYEVRLREKLWELRTSEIKDSMFKLKKLKPSLPDHSAILFINFPLPSRFFEPYIKVYYDLNDVRIVSVLWKKGIGFPNPKDYDINVSGNYFVFARDSKGEVYDISTEWWSLDPSNFPKMGENSLDISIFDNINS